MRSFLLTPKTTTLAFPQRDERTLLTFLSFLDEVGHVHGHLVHARVVELLDVVQGALVVVGDEVDGHALAAETASAADSERET